MPRQKMGGGLGLHGGSCIETKLKVPEEAAAVGRLIEMVDGRCGEALSIYVGQ